MKKIVLPLFFFGLFLFFNPVSAFAWEGSYTASNYCYNTSTHVLTYDVSAESPDNSGNAINDFGIMSPDQGINYAFTSGGTPLTVGATHVSHALTPNIDLPSGSSDVVIYTAVSAGGTIHSQNITVTDLTACGGSPTATPTPPAATATPTPTGVSGGLAISIDPTDAAKMNSALGSIPKQSMKEVFAILPVVMPYALTVIVLGIAFVLLFRFINRAQGMAEDDKAREFEHGDRFF